MLCFESFVIMLWLDLMTTEMPGHHDLLMDDFVVAHDAFEEAFDDAGSVKDILEGSDLFMMDSGHVGTVGLDRLEFLIILADLASENALVHPGSILGLLFDSFILLIILLSCLVVSIILLSGLFRPDLLFGLLALNILDEVVDKAGPVSTEMLSQRTRILC